MPKILVHPEPGLRLVIDADTVYFLEGRGDDTVVHRRVGRKVRAERDVRPLAVIARDLARHGFVRIHKEHVVNPERVRAIRKREGTRDWELQLTPPLNRVLPIARDRLGALWKAY